MVMSIQMNTPRNNQHVYVRRFGCYRPLSNAEQMYAWFYEMDTCQPITFLTFTLVCFKN
jgi:hypothetical protein